MRTEQHAAATLLDKGIKVPVTAPLLLRMLGKRTVNLVIKQPYLGTLYRISWLMLKTRLNDKQLNELNEANAHILFARHGSSLAKVVAAAWLNDYWLGKLFTGLVSKWLYWHLTPIQLLTIANVLVFLSSTQSFTNTIRSVASMKMTKPNLSQQNQGS